MKKIYFVFLLFCILISESYAASCSLDVKKNDYFSDIETFLFAKKIVEDTMQFTPVYNKANTSQITSCNFEVIIEQVGDNLRVSVENSDLVVRKSLKEKTFQGLEFALAEAFITFVDKDLKENFCDTYGNIDPYCAELIKERELQGDSQIVQQTNETESNEEQSNSGIAITVGIGYHFFNTLDGERNTSVPTANWEQILSGGFAKINSVSYLELDLGYNTGSNIYGVRYQYMTPYPSPSYSFSGDGLSGTPEIVYDYNVTNTDIFFSYIKDLKNRDGVLHFSLAYGTTQVNSQYAINSALEGYIDDSGLSPLQDEDLKFTTKGTNYMIGGKYIFTKNQFSISTGFTLIGSQLDKWKDINGNEKYTTQEANADISGYQINGGFNYAF